ncbi:MAG: hypothetical protein GWP63_16550 [Haliea sp.]|nr:hypothetical protein [Haliea sp.]
MFTNKHIIVAMIVAPILAILAWIAVGNLAGEKAAPAKAGQTYRLVEKSNCRYPSGSCDLQNENFKLRLSLQDGPAGQQMVLSASHPLEGVVLSVARPDIEQPPSGMRATDGQGLEWRITLGTTPTAEQRIRLVAGADGSSYFADASTAFLQPGDGPAQR